MTRKFDIHTPAAKALLKVAGERARVAYRAAEVIADATRPVFALDHAQRRFKHVGSCVFVSLASEIFAFSASHVFEQVGPYPVPIGLGNSIHYLKGSRFSSARGGSGTHRDDPIDASVFHIEGDVPLGVRTVAVKVDQLDETSIPQKTFLAAIGFRTKRSVQIGHEFRCHQDIFPSIEYDEAECTNAGVNSKEMLALAYEDEILVDNRWQQAPKPLGMSGGAIVRVVGLPSDPGLRPQEKLGAVLSAIIIERRLSREKVPGMLIGARIGFHLGLIHQYLPRVIERAFGDNYRPQ